MRKEAAKLLGDNLCAESVPLTATQDKSFRVHPVRMSLTSGKRSKTYWIRMRQTWEGMLVLFTCRSYAQSITTSN